MEWKYKVIWSRMIIVILINFILDLGVLIVYVVLVSYGCVGFVNI